MKYLIIIFAVGLLISSCDRNRNQPGWSYFPDMEQSQAYETWSKNPYLPGGKTMVGPVEGTVATHEYAYHFVKTPEDELKAASLENPLADEFNEDHAQILFNRFCIVCHGPEGDGKGYLYTSGKYPIQPANYLNERAMNKTDGQLFHNIRVGFGVMGAHGPMMTVQDSWQLVNYIRYLQKQKTEETQ